LQLGLLVVLAFGLVLAGKEGSSGALGARFQPVPGKSAVSVTSQEVAELWAVDAFGTFVKIDPETAKGTVITQVASIPDILTDIAFASDGTLYAVTWDTLWRIDLENNRAIAISPAQLCINARGVNALTVRKDGILFAAMRTKAELLMIDTTTGCASVVGSLGFFSSGDLNFAPDGKLYAVGQRTIDSSTSALYVVDPANGSSARIGGIGFGRVYGLAFFPDGTLYGATEGRKLIRIDPTTRTWNRDRHNNRGLWHLGIGCKNCETLMSIA
jgi:hypothetical protein